MHVALCGRFIDFAAGPQSHFNPFVYVPLNTDLTAWFSYGWVKFADPVEGDSLVLVGRESDWAKAPMRLVCGRRGGGYFAKVLQSNEEL